MSKAEIKRKPGKKPVAKNKLDTVAHEKHPLMIDAKSWNKQLVMEYICQELASSDKSTATILKAGCNGMLLPSYIAFKEWVKEDAELATQYTRAKDDQADYMAEQILAIADEPPTLDGETGKIDNGWVQWQRTRIEARKWTAAKLKPKKYGEKMQLGGAEDLPPIRQDTTITPDEAYKLMLNGKC